MMKRVLSKDRGLLASLLLMMLVASNLAFSPSWRRTSSSFHAVGSARTQHSVFMAKKTIEDANGISETETSGDIKGNKKSKEDKKIEVKEMKEIESVAETEDIIQTEVSNKTEVAAFVEEEEEVQELEQTPPQNAEDLAQAAIDEEFMHLAIDAAITG